jgi:hypothetical protein
MARPVKPTSTAKERLGRKARDEQRVDQLQGAIRPARPDECDDGASTSSNK